MRKLCEANRAEEQVGFVVMIICVDGNERLIFSKDTIWSSVGGGEVCGGCSEFR